MADKDKSKNKGGTGGEGGEGGEGGGGGSLLDDDTRDEINKSVNAAITARLRRLDLGPLLKDAIDAALTPLREQLATLSGGAAGGDDDQAGKDKKGKGGSLKDDPEVVAMRKRLAAIEDERKAERAAREGEEITTALRDGLTSLKVDPNRLRGAIAVLRDSIVRVDDGNGGKRLAYRAKRDGYDDDIEIAAGLKEWAATDEGKSYLAPQRERPPVGGSGMRVPAGGGRGAAPVQNAAQAKAERKQAAVGKLFDQVGALVGGGNVDL